MRDREQQRWDINLEEEEFSILDPYKDPALVVAYAPLHGRMYYPDEKKALDWLIQARPDLRVLRYGPWVGSERYGNRIVWTPTGGRL